MATVIFAHFGASAVALLLRTQSRPFLRCVYQCAHSFRKCFCCRKEEPAPFHSEGGLKWYWFHLSVQVAFAVREVIVTNSMRWTWELIFVTVAYWLTLAITILEVWRFSDVRNGPDKRKEAVDGLLDMLLLPVNIIFFCAVCVRVLKLQPDSELATMVPVVIESGDIYEAFALWSVLELFVKVVAAEESASGARSFQAFKQISRSGVKLWVWIQTAAVVLKLMLGGIVAVYFPTVCYWASKSCTSCETWYKDNVDVALTAVTFLLCSFAIMFVFYFESGYRQQLEKTEPMWKFLGVKGIVSVTYCQWLVISGLASVWKWDESRVYLFHCLLYTFWMPVLALFHVFLAYPYYPNPCRAHLDYRQRARWLEEWLLTLQSLEPQTAREVASTSQDSCVPEETHVTDADPDTRGGDRVGADESAEASTVDATTPSSGGIDDSRSQQLLSPTRPQSESSFSGALRAMRAWSTIFHFLVAVVACFASFKALTTLIPVEHFDADEPLRNISCSGEGDLAHYLDTRSDLHFALLNDTVQRWSSPGVAGAWLPLCSRTPLGCAPGHFSASSSSLPTLGCSARGQYTVYGSCSAISCGAPPQLPHATPHMSDIRRQNWTYGVTIHYDCDKPGYWGSLSAHCNMTGKWIVEGACVEVTCSTPPAIPHAKALWDPSQGNVSTGIVIRYQCDEMFNGTPTASCGDDGMYMISGRCREECGSPPAVPHAAPRFNNTEVKGGWYAGMRCPYVCDPGYQGFATAVCQEGGNYSVSGHCAPVQCGQPPKLPQAVAKMKDVTKQNFSFGSLVHYTCREPRYWGSLLARCLSTSLWQINGSCHEVTCGEPPALEHASALKPKSNVTAGMVIRYQCDQTFNGTPSAACGVDGQYLTSGRCRKECLGKLPEAPFAVPNATTQPPEGWLSGMAVPYACQPGYGGTVSAMCNSDGNYTIQGGCKKASSAETRSLRSKLTGVSTAMGVENGLILAAVGFVGWQRYRRIAPVRDVSLRDGLAANEMQGMSGPAES